MIKEIPYETVESINEIVKNIMINIKRDNSIYIAHYIILLSNLVKKLKFHYKKRQHLYSQFVDLIRPIEDLNFEIFFIINLRCC